MQPLLGVLLLGTTPVLAAVQQIAEDGSGLPGWHWQGEGTSFTFNQRLPDQTRAFFQGRGFTPQQAEPLARDCVFQAIIRNGAEAAAPMTLNLAGWRVHPTGGSAQPLRLEAQWQEQWERMGVSPPARIAFRWALFPTEQRFEPGDWNMGMITLGLAPGSRFDLEVIWRRGEQEKRQRFPAMQCAAEQ
jgi:hypothetical protein